MSNHLRVNIVAPFCQPQKHLQRKFSTLTPSNSICKRDIIKVEVKSFRISQNQSNPSSPSALTNITTTKVCKQNPTSTAFNKKRHLQQVVKLRLQIHWWMSAGHSAPFLLSQLCPLRCLHHLSTLQTYLQLNNTPCSVKKIRRNLRDGIKESTFLSSDNSCQG